MLKYNGYLALVWNMYLITESKEDQMLFKISKKYGGFADFVDQQQCEERIDSIVKSIKDSSLFEVATVYRNYWIQDYTAEEYYGFLLTGNQFVQLAEEAKQAAYEEIKNHANRFGGKITRPYLCVLYLAKKMEN